MDAKSNRKQPNKKPVSAATRMFNLRIGEQIRRIREGNHVMQSDLSRSIGYASAHTVHYMESGRKLIMATDLAAIANYLGVTIRSLYPKGSVR